MAEQDTHLLETPLHALHEQLGAKMVGFAGYSMPIQFEGVKAEHLWTREHCGLFDVSHMGPCFLTITGGPRDDAQAHIEVAKLIEQLVPSDIQGLKPGQARLTVLLNEDGGILDDLIITRPRQPHQQGMLYIVVNGAMKHQDWELIRKSVGPHAELTRADDHILVALQGPDAEAVVTGHFPQAAELGFMECIRLEKGDLSCLVSRCGYTGEDGFELLIPSDGVAFVTELLADERVKPIGLGARDSLRLEAGLCLYGHDLDPEKTPVEASLTWVIQKNRREAADFPGATKILDQIANGPRIKRVGIQPLDRAPAREGTPIMYDDVQVGEITSGGFGPSVDAPVAMGYVEVGHAKIGTELTLMVRGKPRAAKVAKLPFVPHNYKR
ncbi:MAG: glycine cleavage system protein T [Ponticaulis sp.]|nr:glycine cleavage system protein T [Ponticaulis sp.]